MRLRLTVFAVLLLSGVSLFAQGTSGQLTGSVTTGGNSLPGVTVTVSSASMQGTRTAVTGETGGYNIAGLPPGMYDVTFELEGMQRLTRRARVELAQTVRADAELKVSAVSESVTVTATTPSVAETPQIATTFDAQTIDELPVNRTITDTVLISPGVNDGGPNDQIIISGAPSFDSLFLVNGVVVNENLRGQPQNLFIEDAIQETTILRGAISAEYGRFTGGVVTTITKSGGNEFSGSFRDSLTNDNWTAKTPFAGQADPIDNVNEVYEATLGGRIIRDRLWFFVAGRKQDAETSNQTRLTNLPYEQLDKRDRYEVKLTGQPFKNYDVVGSYISSKVKRTGVASGRIVDLRSLTTREEPNTLKSLHYGGVLTNNLLVEAQYSRMDFAFSQGAETRDLIDGTILLDVVTGNRGWSPTFCGSICPKKERDNKSMLLKGSYFLSTGSLGNHSLTGGYEDFHQLRNENNFQSGSDFRIHGNHYFDGTTLYFGVDPNTAQIEWDPVPALSNTSDFGVKSLFLNNKWDLTPRWGFNVGVRYDKADGKDQEGKKTVDDSAFSPRLSATWDPVGTGKHLLTASYSRYVSKVDQGPADVTAAAGRYASYYFDYKGPAINPPGTPFGAMVPVPEVIRRVFEWFNANGGPNGSNPYLVDVSIPGVTSRIEGSLAAPSMDEVSLGYALALGRGGYIRADALHREWQDFYVIRRTRDTGTTTLNGTIFDTGVVENSSDNLSRKYDGIQLQGAYRLLDMFNLGGNYTWSKLRGNVEQEAASFATTLADSNNYPEYTGFEQNAPVGFLGADMRHRANAWIDVSPPIGFGELSISLLQKFHSGLPYSASGAIDVRSGQARGPANGVVNPGYQRPPATVLYYFSDRGEYRLDDIWSTDLGLRYTIPVMRAGITLLADVLNAFDMDGVEDPDFISTTIRTRVTGANFGLTGGPPARAFNPLAGEAPVEGVNWLKNANFGQPLTKDAYQQPRTYRFGVRVRF